MLRGKHELKKGEILPVCLYQTKKKNTAKRNHTKEFCSLWAEKLCASDNSWYIYNQEMWLEEPMENIRERERERRVCEPLKDYGRAVSRRRKRR